MRHASAEKNSSTADAPSTAETSAEDKGKPLPTITVIVNGLADKQLENAKQYLEIDDEKQVKNPTYSEYLIAQGVQQIQDSLKPFGYYLAEVTVNTQRTPALWTVTYDVERGKPVRADKVVIRIEGEGEQQDVYQQLVNDYPIKTGDILVQEKYKDFKGELAKLATTYGYFDGHFTKKQIVMGKDYQHADIAVTYDTSQRYAFGDTSIKQDFLDDDVFQRFITYQTGEPYSAKAIANVQRDLYNSNYVKMVDVSAEPVKADKTVPVDFVLTPKKNKKHTFAIGYGTDTGVRGKYDFDWRWVNRRGHQFNSKLFVSQKHQELGIAYRIPALRPATDHYQLFAKFSKDQGGDIHSTLWNMGTAYRDVAGNWERQVGIKWQEEDFSVGNDGGNISLLTPFAALTYRHVDDPLNITRGALLKAEVTGGHESLLSDVSFLQAVAEAKGIRKIKQHKVKLTGAIGRTWVNDFHHLPAAYRFFTGGDRTIRGYAFNSIGDHDSSGDNIGGNKLFYASAEYEYFFTDSMAGAVFVDAGDAYSADKATVKVGAGVGFHYYSPIGPIRLDVGHGFDKDRGDKFRVHLNIGPEF